MDIDQNKRFIINDARTVLDTTTGLTWQRETAGLMPWGDAKNYCSRIELVCGDWRLPTIHELQSLIDYARFNPAIDTIVFPRVVSSCYWSSTTYADSTNFAWCVNFCNGNLNYSYKPLGYYVRAVRG